MKFQIKSFGLGSQGWVGLTSVSPKQMLDIAGGNILIRKGAGNPYALNGCLFFGDDNEIFGKWGIEYLSTTQDLIGGLNFFRTSSIEFGAPVNYSLFIKNNCNVGIGTNNPIAKFQVEGNAIIKNGLVLGEILRPTTLNVYGEINSSSLLATAEKYVVGADAQGKLILLGKNQIGDNMGNCEAGYNIKMSNYSILNGSLGDKSLERADGSTFNPGLRFSTDNSMILETGQSAKLALVSGSNIASSMWVASWTSGGYGLVLNGDNKTGGIYRDANNPTLAIGFNSTKVGIGVIPPAEGSYALYVAGGILATEVKVQLQSEWKDVVFLPEYKLRSIKEVKAYIAEYGHLPEVPDSKTVESEGINIGEMNALLLQKIEELTLYIIDQQKQIDEQQDQIKTITNNLSK